MNYLLRRSQKPTMEPVVANAHFCRASSYPPDRMMKRELQSTATDTKTIMVSPMVMNGLRRDGRGEGCDSDKSGLELMAIGRELARNSESTRRAPKSRYIEKPKRVIATVIQTSIIYSGCVETPNEPKLSHGGGWQGSCRGGSAGREQLP